MIMRFYQKMKTAKKRCKNEGMGGLDGEQDGGAIAADEFVAYEKNWKKRLLMQFVGGIARGLGTAVGFTLLGALVVWLLQGLVQRNLPIIGDFLTQLLNLVEGKGSGS